MPDFDGGEQAGGDRLEIAPPRRLVEEPAVELAESRVDGQPPRFVAAEGIGAAGVVELVDQQRVDRGDRVAGLGRLRVGLARETADRAPRRRSSRRSVRRRVRRGRAAVAFSGRFWRSHFRVSASAPAGRFSSIPASQQRNDRRFRLGLHGGGNRGPLLVKGGRTAPLSHQQERRMRMTGELHGCESKLVSMVIPPHLAAPASSSSPASFLRASRRMLLVG